MKTCIACGMPMAQPNEFAMGDPTKDYCVHCARPDGSMQTYEEKLTSLTAFIMKMQGFEESAAKASAKDMMSRLPAWRGRA